MHFVFSPTALPIRNIKLFHAMLVAVALLPRLLAVDAARSDLTKAEIAARNQLQRDISAFSI